MFGITPEPLDAVDMGSPLRNSFTFGHLDMRPTQSKTGVSPVLDCVAQAANGGVGVVKGQQFGSAPRRYGQRSNMLIPLVNAEYDGFPLGSLATWTSPEFIRTWFHRVRVADPSISYGLESVCKCTTCRVG